VVRLHSLMPERGAHSWDEEPHKKGGGLRSVQATAWPGDERCVGRCISGNNNTLNWDGMLSMAVGASWEGDSIRGSLCRRVRPARRKGRSSWQPQTSTVGRRRRSYSGLAGAGRQQAGRQAGRQAAGWSCNVERARSDAPGCKGGRRASRNSQ
jgi:hypothetical protein